ncbi:MAG: MCE family protein [Saprospiraceae bacterium]|nr:MCE family protein [Saprospiraceae bacterium]
MSKETKLGLFAVMILAITIWGYYYLKGRNLLARDQTFYVEYQDIGDLMISSPVKINGLQVGTVVDIRLDKEDMRTIIAELHVDRQIGVPPSAVAVIEPLGVMGGSSVALEFDQPCREGGCAPSGSTLQGGTASLMSKMLDQDQLDAYLDKLKSGLGEVIDSLDVASSDPDSRDLVGQSLYDTRQILSNTRITTEALAALVIRVSGQLESVMGHLENVTGTLDASHEEIARILSNTQEITGQVKDADIGKTIEVSRSTLEQINTTVTDLGRVSSELQTVLLRLNEGEGTLGRLIRDPEIYTNLQRTSRNLDLLLQDFRLNPKRYVNVSLIGRKDKPYRLPEEDPAFPGKEQK